eukprot:Gregarina_sp_Poly_1__5531@NODE_291_length_9945_cov_44_133124_g252_i0_p12_GENE_NODE_291_length_9945_cov_44_133124_g252_i0NODE_291_length_9945_cov_44_133124_g252_i0_p12_ORF_typecomplete_len101_score7_27PolyA_pol/PF01743_20/0_16_NODE_291_length_9945_cov_44_133124_g252_i060516353
MANWLIFCLQIAGFELTNFFRLWGFWIIMQRNETWRLKNTGGFLRDVALGSLPLDLDMVVCPSSLTANCELDFVRFARELGWEAESLMCKPKPPAHYDTS